MTSLIDFVLVKAELATLWMILAAVSSGNLLTPVPIAGIATVEARNCSQHSMALFRHFSKYYKDTYNVSLT